MNKEQLAKNKWFRAAVITLITFGFILPAAKPTLLKHPNRDVSVEAFTQYLDGLISARMERYGVAGVSAALIHNGEMVWREAYGYADKEQGIEMTPDTVCRVESISKSVTAWGIMKLVQEGKLDLDTPVTQYLTSWEFPDSPYPVDEITVRMLLSNRSGLPEGDYTIRFPAGYETIPTLRETVGGQASCVKPPGDSFLYSNVGFNLLEIIIEDVTGRSFSEYMTEEILTPLGMVNSSFDWNGDWNPPVPVGYTVGGERVPVYVYPEKGSGGLFATAGDIARFTAAGMYRPYGKENTILDQDHLRGMYAPVTELSGYYRLVFDAYGLGHLVETLKNGKTAVAHGGQGAGVMTHFQSFPETGDGIVILSNSQRSWPFFAEIIGTWASWKGFSAGMETMLTGQIILWVVIGMILFWSLWQLWGVGMGLTFRTRRFAPFFKTSILRRIFLVIAAAGLIFAFFWSLSQPYFFLFSVFPVASYWLLFSLLTGAAAMLAGAVFPNHARTERSA